MHFSDISLNEGYLIMGTEEAEEEITILQGSSTRGIPQKRVSKKAMTVWSAREASDCLEDAEVLRKDLLDSFKYRRECVHPALVKLQKCLDLSEMLILLAGNHTPGEDMPYDSLSYALYGRDSFTELVEHVALLPQVKDHSCVCIHPALSMQIFDNKTAIASTIWGRNFNDVGAKMFEIIEGDLKGKRLSDLKCDLIVLEFALGCVSENFSIEPCFNLKVNAIEQTLLVKFDETIL